MGRMEVLAHITAPSGFEDDEKYLAQAIAVAHSEACLKLRVYGPGDQSDEIVEDGKRSCDSTQDTFNTSLSFSAWRQAEIMAETPAQYVARQLLSQNSAARQKKLLER